jgi:GNAT superfamily N-acetyltransferase
LRGSIRIRRGTEEDISRIERAIAKWLNWEIKREESIRRAVENKELLVADHEGDAAGFIHYVMHEDIIDGGLNCFITAFYVAPEFRKKGVGSILLRAAIRDSIDRGAVGVEASTASLDASRLYEKHFFKQFMGSGSMGEVFLELDIKKYKKKWMHAQRIDRLWRVRRNRLCEK